MAIFDISRLRGRSFADVNELAREIVSMFEGINTGGLKAPVLIKTVGDEPAIMIHMPSADLEEIPPVQIRSSLQSWIVPAWHTGYTPIPIAPVPGLEIPDTPHPPPYGNEYPDITRTDGATASDPQEERWWAPPLTVQATNVSGTTPDFIMDVFLADPATGVPYMRLPVTDRTGAIVLGAGDKTSVTLYYPLALQGGVEAFIV